MTIKGQFKSTMSTRKDQRKQIRLSNFDFINFLLTVSGLRPVFDYRTRSGRKYYLLGITLVIVHIGLNVFCDFQQSDEQSLLRLFYDKIMFAMVTLKRIVNLLYPLWMVLAAVGQFNSSTVLNKKLDKLDSYLKTNNANMKFLRLKMRKFTQVTLLIGIGCSVGSILSTAWYAITLFNNVEFYHIFGATFYYLGFALVTMKACKYLYGIASRFDLFEELLIKINLNQSHFDYVYLERFQK